MFMGDTTGAILTPVYADKEGTGVAWSALKDPAGTAVVNAVDGAFYPYVVNLAQSGITATNLVGWKISSSKELYVNSIVATSLAVPQLTTEYPHLDTANAKVFDSFTRTQAKLDTTYEAASTNTVVTDSGLNFSVCYSGVNNVSVDGDNLVLAPNSGYTQVTEGSKTACGTDKYMVPSMLAIFPLVMEIKDFHLINSYLPLWLSFGSNAYYYLLFKDYFEKIPASLLEAARMDGGNDIDVFFRVVLPLSRPVIGVVAIFAMTASYSDFLLPYLVLNDQKMQTVMHIDSEVPLHSSETTDKEVSLDYRFTLEKKKTYVFTRNVINLVDKEGTEKIPEMKNQALAELQDLIERGFAGLLHSNLEYFKKVWDRSDIEIDGDDADQQGIRYCIFQLEQTYHGYAKDDNIGAKGLTGEAYSGHDSRPRRNHFRRALSRWEKHQRRGTRSPQYRHGRG